MVPWGTPVERVLTGDVVPLQFYNMWCKKRYQVVSLKHKFSFYYLDFHVNRKWRDMCFLHINPDIELYTIYIKGKDKPDNRFGFV